MKLEFKKNDSIYKIVNAIKKIPNYKKVSVKIHPDHRIFSHQRRGNYLSNLIDEHHLDITFVSSNLQTKNYRKSAWLPHTDIFDKSLIQQFTDWKKNRTHLTDFHKNILVRKNYVSGLVLLTELWFLLWLLYVFWSLMSPNATIVVSPAYTVDEVVYNFRYYPHGDKQVHQFQSYLSVPYYTWSLLYNYDMTLNVQNIKYTQEPAIGTIQIFNTHDYAYSLLDNSTLVSEDGLLFKTQKRVDVPRGNSERPGTARVRVLAESNFENGELIGSKGNLTKGTLLHFKNTNEEERQKVRATAWNNFEWGETIETGTVIEQDIKDMEASIIQQMQDYKSAYLQSNVDEPDQLILTYPENFMLDIEEFITTSDVGESTAFVEGKVKSQLYYPYIKRQDLQYATNQYLDQRSQDSPYLVEYNRDEIVFFDKIDIEKDENLPAHYVIPTQVPLIKRYDIHKDQLGIVSEIKDKITWLDKEAAKKIILAYDEIDSIDIRISPSRFSIVPSIKSRINFKFE